MTPLRTILNSSWTKWIGGGLGGMVISVFWSFAPDAFWIHDNRQLLNTLILNQPLVQRDISDLRTQLAENTIALKELAVEIQKSNNSRKPQRLILEKGK